MPCLGSQQQGMRLEGLPSLWGCGQPGSALSLGHQKAPVAGGIFQGEAARRRTLCTGSFLKGLVLLIPGLQYWAAPLGHAVPWWSVSSAAREHLAQGEAAGP